MLVSLLAQAAAAGEPTDWAQRFIESADRVVAGTVRTVRIVPHARWHAITEIVLDVDEVLLGTVGQSVTVIQPGDATRPGPHGIAAPREGDEVILGIGPWLGDPALLQLRQYVGSTVLAGRVVTVDGFGESIGAIDCTNGPADVDEPEVWGPTVPPRSPWDGPDPERVAARQAGALDWSVARPQALACLRAALGR